MSGDHAVGQIFAHFDDDGVYARVDGFDAERGLTVFAVWEVARPGWQEGACLPSSDFSRMYNDGPYPKIYVERATEEYWFDRTELSTPTQDMLRDALVGSGLASSRGEAEHLMDMVLLEHRRQLAADLNQCYGAMDKSSPTRRGLKLALHRLRAWKMSPAQSAPEGDQTTT